MGGDAPAMTPSRVGSPKGRAMTSVMEPKSSSRVVWFTFGRCSASFTGISLVQIDPAARPSRSSAFRHDNTIPKRRRTRKTKRKGERGREGKGKGTLTNSAADGPADLGPEEDHGGGDGHVDVGYGGLSRDGRGDGREAAAEALEDLCPDDLRVGRVRAARVDHQPDAPADANIVPSGQHKRMPSRRRQRLTGDGQRDPQRGPTYTDGGNAC